MTTYNDKGRWNRILLTLGAAGLLALPVLPGCAVPLGGSGGADPFDGGAGGDNNGVTDDDDDNSVSGLAVLTGVVRDAMGAPMADVTVSTPDGTSATSTIDGRFRLEGLEPDARSLVNFRKAGFARTQTPIELIADTENTILQIMAEVDFVDTFSSADGLSFDIEAAGPAIVLPADNFIDADGNIYEGDITVEATFYDLTSGVDQGNELFATPGDFTATDLDGADQTLESFGMFQINLMDASGQDLNLAGSTSSVIMPIQDLGAPPTLGDQVPAWSYDEDSGKWVEEAIGTVIELTDGTLAWEFQAPHFSTWNCDRPIQTHGCLTGTVVDSQGNPRGGATVRAVGITYISTTTARTGQDGSFCLEVKNGETVWAEISYSIAGQTATQRTDPVTISPGTASCSLGTSTCDDLGEIPVDIQTCVSGIVVDAQNAPQSDVQVVSPQGGVATTDAAGSFCLTVPVFQTTDVYVLTEQDADLAYVPVRLYAQPGLPNCQSGCPNQPILRPYVNMSCSQGYVVVDGQVAGNVLVEVFDLNYPEVRVSSTLTNSDGSFCASLPGDTNVSVQVGPSDNVCASETVDTDGMGGQQCGDSGQTGECMTLNDFICSL
jgi:hypothetical protein